MSIENSHNTAIFGNISSHSFLEGPVLVRQDQSGKFWWSGPVRKDLNLLGPLVHYPAPLSGPTKYLFFKSCVQVYNLTFCFYTLKTKLIIVHTLSFSMFLSIIIHTCQIKRLRKSVKLVTSLLQVHFCADRNARIMYIYCTYITNLLTQCIAGHSLIYIPSESEKLSGTHYLGKKSRKGKVLQRVCFTVLANRDGSMYLD